MGEVTVTEEVVGKNDPDGGYVYPCKTLHRVLTKVTDSGGTVATVGNKTIEHPGMTLRDYFAGQALVGILASGDMWTLESVSAYNIADAMLKARKGNA